MSGPAPTYHSLQKTTNREAILDAVERCLDRGGLDELTFAQVAQEAGVSDRTVYRHFPTREALLDSFWVRVQQTLGIERATRSWADFLETRSIAFAQMDRRESLMRAVMRSAEAHDARMRIKAQRQAGLRKVVAEAVGNLEEPAFTELCALVHLLGSAPAWATLKDHWGIDGKRAGRVVADAVSTLAREAAKSKGRKK
jgi:AcrR family transcriptional regulator